MPTYSVLVQPSFNRVYAKAAPAIGAAEIETVVALACPGLCTGVEQVRRGGVDYLDVHVPDPAAHGAGDAAHGPDAPALLAALSATFTVFERHDGALVPVDAEDTARYDDDLTTTLRYSGKTNDQFTKLLLNLALAAADGGIDALLGGGSPAAGEPRFRVLDPVCGRGTTLNQALLQGFDVVGIDASRKDHDLYVAFLKKYLQDHRIKHTSQSFAVKKGPAAPAARTTFTITPPAREAGGTPPSRRVTPQAGAPQTVTPQTVTPQTVTPQTVDAIFGDSVHAREFLTRSSVDVIVGDLPYGVQHASRNDQWGASRNPATMLAAALPAWRQVLRGGGAMALAWNTKVLPRTELEAHVRAAGFSLALHGNEGRFLHTVDRTITRDVLLATKPTA